jgi:hypothetical protein
MNRLAAVCLSFGLSACLTPVPEGACATNADCDAGTCVDSKCVAGNTGGGAAATGGGQAVGGGDATGGGDGTGGGSTGTGGGSVVGGGSGGGEPACGCLDRRGNCQPGDAPLACGSGMNMCQACAIGQQCINGACMMGACGPQSCAGCCVQNFCVVPSMQANAVCGAMGAACMSCQNGQTCQNGMCAAPPVCNASTCNGCCQNGQCVGGNSRMSCGTGGVACARCTPNEVCTQGVCAAVAGVDAGSALDAGMDVAPGSPCQTAQECQPPTNAICVGETVAGQATGYTGGYCTARCGGATATCPVGSPCVTENFMGLMQQTCRAPCAQPLTQSTCRADYVCQPAMTMVSIGFCRPKCTVPGLLSACPTGTTCDMATGACR